MTMTMTRRQLVRKVAASAGGMVLSGTVIPANAQSQATPAASPGVSSPPLLISAGELLHTDPAPQLLAIMDQDTFNTGHLRDAVQIPWPDLSLEDTSEDAVAAWTEKMREMVAVKGLRPDLPIVVYDQGTLFAARGWWQLAYLGYESPKVLDGGLPAWREAGGETEAAGAPVGSPVEAPVVEANVRRDLLATKAEVLASLEDPDVLLVDARSAQEYGMGHIPGAVNMVYTSNAIMKDANTYLPSDHLRSMYEELGMTAEKRAITYCSTGVRGSVASFAMCLAGFQQVSLYVGSWNEWSRDPDAPVE